MARRSAEDTRLRILDSALQLLLERGASTGVQHIRLQEALQRVGLTTGAAYRIWADQRDFHKDLAIAMMRLRFAAPTDSVSRAVGQILADDGPLDDIIRVAADDHVAVVSRFYTDPDSRDSHAFLTALSLRTATGSDPELRQAAADRHHESIDEFCRFYELLLDRYGYRPRTPFTVRDFAEAMAALGEGFAVRAAEGLGHPTYEIESGHEAREGTWSLFGYGIRALFDAFMVRCDATPDRI